MRFSCKNLLRTTELFGAIRIMQQLQKVEIRILGNEYDTLTGGSGADRFLLDGLSLSNPNLAGVGYQYDSYAVITDFSSTEGDKMSVYGSISTYKQISQSIIGIGSSAPDTEIYYATNLVAFVADVADISFSRDFL